MVRGEDEGAVERGGGGLYRNISPSNTHPMSVQCEYTDSYSGRLTSVYKTDSHNCTNANNIVYMRV